MNKMESGVLYQRKYYYLDSVIYISLMKYEGGVVYVNRVYRSEEIDKRDRLIDVLYNMRCKTELESYVGRVLEIDDEYMNGEMEDIVNCIVDDILCLNKKIE